MSLFRRLSAAFLSCWIAASSASAVFAAGSEESLSVIVFTESGVVPASVLEQIPGATLTAEYDIFDGFAADIPAGSQNQLSRIPGVTAVSHAATFAAPLVSTASSVDPTVLSPDDTVARAENVNDGSGVVIAVIDSAFDASHPVFVLSKEAETEAKLTREIVAETDSIALRYAEDVDEIFVSTKIPLAFDYDGMDSDVSGDSSHGTHVAATAAGSVAGEGALNGVAPGAQLLLMKVFSDDGEKCREASLVSAVQDAIHMGADVINMSLGALAYSSEVYSMAPLARALAKAEEAGILVVCANGNDGFVGAGGVNSSLPSVFNPDYGLPSEPAILPEALSVGSAVNSVYYAWYLEAAGRKILYYDSGEAGDGTIASFKKALSGRSLPLVVVPGFGLTEDYEKLRVTGAVVLVRRGEITFAEKVANAGAAGAIGVIVYDPNSDDSFSMSIGEDAPIPAVSIGRADGEFLASLVGESIVVSDRLGSFDADAGIASYSSWGPTADLNLKPEIAAVGSYVISAVPGGEYASMSGTSMASPQIAGYAACAISAHRALWESADTATRAARLKAYLMSVAEPIFAQNGVRVSPRAQGAGVIGSLDADVLLETESGGALLLGDGIEGGFSFTLTATSLTDSDATYRLRAPLLTDVVEQGEDGGWYFTGESERVRATIAVTGENVRISEGRVYVTIPAGESVTLSCTLTPNAEQIAEIWENCPNGFYLEGFVLLEDENGAHKASLPYMGFAGRWGDAPVLDAMDWDGETSFFGLNQLWQNMRGEAVLAGTDEAGSWSSLFAFSPDGDGAADEIYLAITLMRNASAVELDILDESGEVLLHLEDEALLKSHEDDDGETAYNLLRLWDGSDGINDHFFFADGTYTMRLTLYSFADSVQIVEIPVRMDTVKPELVSVHEENGVVTARFADAGGLRNVMIYLPDPEEDGEHVVHEEAELETGATEAVVSAEIPAGTQYVYIQAEDFAGNRMVVRYYMRG